VAFTGTGQVRYLTVSANLSAIEANISGTATPELAVLVQHPAPIAFAASDFLLS
jgi:hypothetical protein